MCIFARYFSSTLIVVRPHNLLLLVAIIIIVIRLVEYALIIELLVDLLRRQVLIHSMATSVFITSFNLLDILARNVIISSLIAEVLLLKLFLLLSVRIQKMGWDLSRVAHYRKLLLVLAMLHLSSHVWILVHSIMSAFVNIVLAQSIIRLVLHSYLIFLFKYYWLIEIVYLVLKFR